jgi:hypothetical protein
LFNSTLPIHFYCFLYTEYHMKTKFFTLSAISMLLISTSVSADPAGHTGLMNVGRTPGNVAVPASLSNSIQGSGSQRSEGGGGRSSHGGGQVSEDPSKNQGLGGGQVSEDPSKNGIQNTVTPSGIQNTYTPTGGQGMRRQR